MKTLYFWYGVIIIIVATLINYGTVSSSRSYSSGGFSTYSTGSWHK
ncbi:hypothetical protein PE074_00355 [Wohlfahrtiimonas chitiniclastica]|uniref:Uncharacterized protein n=1 Tax=Wohlfahrtiimonas chitiniclastica TaxID=400946 RepID=A0AB35C3J7_9GAMM|nr:MULTISPECIES: hypothetical protein [Wohlfahrtiimonas]KZS23016.1 hypothetical protein BMY_0851 [Wohlfahrtiimonas chitiniclastica]MBS7817400.1 hypothetical protein [Wohlfahrtiimonas chitiniclastica]MBS7819595.1 hypothetical protein [Wohlfahrtiimonas chitiniclastica]MBS7821548.1 hypothetical protein [Wohlfahrtiimonas chitiniclastica]MBS7823532.1 hypothetical protein [Wohlfahrtiimonas chitiniclastica]